MGPCAPSRTGPSCLPHSAKFSIAVTARNPRLFSVHPRYYVFYVNAADRNPIAQFGQARDFALTLGVLHFRDREAGNLT